MLMRLHFGMTSKSWPAPGNLYLDGFVYGAFAGGSTGELARLRWLRLQPLALQAQPQPYRQLAQVFRDGGREEGAARVEIAREDALTKYGGKGIAGGYGARRCGQRSDTGIVRSVHCGGFSASCCSALYCSGGDMPRA